MAVRLTEKQAIEMGIIKGPPPSGPAPVIQPQGLPAVVVLLIGLLVGISIGFVVTALTLLEYLTPCQ